MLVYQYTYMYKKRPQKQTWLFKNIPNEKGKRLAGKKQKKALFKLEL